MRAAVVALAVLAWAPLGEGGSVYREAAPQPAQGAARGSGPVSPGPLPDLPDLSGLAAAALPAVVGVLTTELPTGGRGADRPSSADPGDRDDALRGLLDHLRADAPRHGVATGFVVHPDGWIVTNAHVVEGATRVEVELGDDEERLPARVIGRDASSDVALLKVEAHRPLAVLPLGDSDQLRIAEWVLVVGNPFGLSHTVTAGIVSQVGRSAVAPAGRDGYYDFIQTDASINPGNSGGPLLNLRGEVVGIATAVNANGQGIGFAVPINMAKQILDQLRRHGKVVHSWMGVAVRELRGHSEPPGPAARGRELLVTAVTGGGPADAGGLRVGDVITGLDGQRIASAARLRWFVATAGVGRALSITVRRGGGVRSVRVRLGELPASALPAAGPGDPGPRGEPEPWGPGEADAEGTGAGP